MEAREEYDFVAATFAVGLDQRFDLSEVGLVVEEPAAATSLHMLRTLEIFAFRSETVDIQTWIWQNLVLNVSTASCSASSCKLGVRTHIIFLFNARPLTLSSSCQVLEVLHLLLSRRRHSCCL